MNHAEKADTQGASKPPVPEQSHTLRATLPTRFYDRALWFEIRPFQGGACGLKHDFPVVFVPLWMTVTLRNGVKITTTRVASGLRIPVRAYYRPAPE